MSFKKNFIKLCQKNNVSPTRALTDMGYSRGTYSYWTENSIPNPSTLLKIAEYFGVTTEDLLVEQEENYLIKGFGSKLKEVIEEKGKTVEEISKELEISVLKVNKWLNDELSPTVAELQKLSVLLNVSTDYLIFGKKKSKEEENLLKLISSLSDEECEKISIFIQGMIINRK